MSEQWGRVEPDGTVYLRTAEGERPVGSYPGATPEAALAYFVRKFEDLQAQVALLEQRVAAGHVAAGQLESSVRRLSEAVTAANVVGDLDGLLARLAGLGDQAHEHRAQAEAAALARRDQARLDREALVAAAELIAEQHPDQIHWKSAGERLTELFEQWKAAQRRTRLAKADEDALWHRFSHARTGFDRKRRHHFAALEESRQAARATKERLITEAERLAGLTDWGAGAAGFRDLMREWKAAGRVAGQDDALWARFKAAQDAFFAARGAATSQEDTELRANLTVKEQLLDQAETQLPVTDVAAARAGLRELQSRLDAAGRVPRADLGRVEARLRAIEQAVRDAEQARAARSNPQARARAADVVTQLESAIAGLERDRDRARATGNDRRAGEAEAAIAARLEWLAQARNVLADFDD